ENIPFIIALYSSLMYGTESPSCRAMLDQFSAMLVDETDTITEFLNGETRVTVTSSLFSLPFLSRTGFPWSSITVSLAAFMYPKMSSSGYLIGFAEVNATLLSRTTGESSHPKFFCRVSLHQYLHA